MRTLAVNTFLTLDGVMQGPGGPDEYRLLIFPLLVGPGKRLFAEGTIPAGLKLRDSKTSTTGVIMATYEPAGAIPLGSFALSQPTDEERARRRTLAKE